MYISCRLLLRGQHFVHVKNVTGMPEEFNLDKCRIADLAQQSGGRRGIHGPRHARNTPREPLTSRDREVLGRAGETF
jgi:hypothetical protein